LKVVSAAFVSLSLLIPFAIYDLTLLAAQIIYCSGGLPNYDLPYWESNKEDIRADLQRIYGHMDLCGTFKKVGYEISLSITALCRFAQQVLLALAHPKKWHIIHPDPKPDNILVSEEEKLVGIFALTSLTEASKSTPQNTGPEQNGGERASERRSHRHTYKERPEAVQLLRVLFLLGKYTAPHGLRLLVDCSA
jgi:serine/threonine protein kinase